MFLIITPSKKTFSQQLYKLVFVWYEENGNRKKLFCEGLSVKLLLLWKGG